MPVYHKQHTAQLIQALHEVRCVISDMLRDIAGLYQEFHSCNIKHLADTGFCSSLYSIKQLFWILLKLLEICIRNGRPGVSILGHCNIAAFPLCILFCLLGDVEHIALRVVAMRTFERLCKHKLSHLRHNIILPYNMQSCFFCLHRLCLTLCVCNYILGSFGVYLNPVVFLTLVCIERMFQ